MSKAADKLKNKSGKKDPVISANGISKKRANKMLLIIFSNFNNVIFIKNIELTYRVILAKQKINSNNIHSYLSPN